MTKKISCGRDIFVVMGGAEKNNVGLILELSQWELGVIPM